MADYDNNLRGVLFKNNRKTADKQPDFKGNCEIDGVQYWVSAWKKTSAKVDGTFLSLSFTKKDEFEDKPKKEEEPRKESNVQDDIPF